MTIDEMYADDEIMRDMTKSDLAIAMSYMDKWVKGGDVDLEKAYFIGMTLINLSQCGGSQPKQFG